ncbi:MAG: CPBP family intramembrane glutamic endopeptidase [Planctomycetota bacterium]
MMMPDDERPPGAEPDGPEEPEPAFVLVAGVIVYGMMGTAAVLWLWWRDRLDVLPEQAIGRHGPLLASGAGLAVGLLGAGLLGAAMRRSAALGEIATTVERMFARASDATGLAFVLISAIAEELFFRLAVQDALGLIGSVAFYVLLNSTVGGVRWILFTVLHALVLGLLVHFGFGLLGSTTAHAILNYLSLRRLQQS